MGRAAGRPNALAFEDMGGKLRGTGLGTEKGLSEEGFV